MVYEEASQTAAAKIGGVTLRIVRGCMLKFDAAGPAGLIDRKAPGRPPRLAGRHRAALTLARGKPATGRCWVCVRDGRALGGSAVPAAMFYYSADRAPEHPLAHLANYAGLLQANAYRGYGKLYESDRRPGPVLEAACWIHARRPFLVRIHPVRAAFRH